MSHKLKNCPFCGHGAIVVDGAYYGQYVHCSNQKCSAEMGRLEDDSATNGDFDGVGDAARAWNTRADTNVESIDVDWLAQTIRKADGDNKLGAGALAEAIITELKM